MGFISGRPSLDLGHPGTARVSQVSPEGAHHLLVSQGKFSIAKLIVVRVSAGLDSRLRTSRAARHESWLDGGAVIRTPRDWRI